MWNSVLYSKAINSNFIGDYSSSENSFEKDKLKFINGLKCKDTVYYSELKLG